MSNETDNIPRPIEILDGPGGIELRPLTDSPEDLATEARIRAADAARRKAAPVPRGPLSHSVYPPGAADGMEGVASQLTLDVSAGGAVLHRVALPFSWLARQPIAVELSAKPAEGVVNPDPARYFDALDVDVRVLTPNDTAAEVATFLRRLAAAYEGRV